MGQSFSGTSLIQGRRPCVSATCSSVAGCNSYYPQKRTFFSAVVMSALCQKRTHAPQQLTSYPAPHPRDVVVICRPELRRIFASSEGMWTQLAAASRCMRHAISARWPADKCPAISAAMLTSALMGSTAGVVGDNAAGQRPDPLLDWQRREHIGDGGLYVRLHRVHLAAESTAQQCANDRRPCRRSA